MSQPSTAAPLPVGATFSVVEYATETWIDANTGEAVRFRRPYRTTATVVAQPSP